MGGNKQKKPPKNSYFFFITDMKNQHNLYGFKVASERFGPLWSKMSKEQKAPYEEMSKRAKEEDKFNMQNKFTVTGETYAEVDRKNLGHREEQERMIQFIEHLTSGPEATRRMYILIKGSYCVVESVAKKSFRYWPNELAACVFNLEEGIKATYWQMVDSVVTPTGYASDAKDNCEETHLPLPGDPVYDEECRDYLLMLKRFNGLANHWLKDGYQNVGGHRRVFFALDKEIEPIRSSLQWLVDQVDDKYRRKYQKFVNNLKIYSLSRLLLGMAQEAHRVNPEYQNYLVQYKLDQAAESVVTKGNYDYVEEIACPYHRKRATFKMHMCVQSIVMRRAYMLFDEFVPAYKLAVGDRHSFKKLKPRDFKEGPMTKKLVCGIYEKRDVQTDDRPIEPEPDWMKDKINEKPNPTTVPETYDAWGHRPVPPASFEDSDFPSLGSANKSRGAAPSWVSNSSPRRPSSSDSPPLTGAGRGRGGHGYAPRPTAPPAAATTRSFMDDDDDEFPSLSSSTGRGRGSRY